MKWIEMNIQEIWDGLIAGLILRIYRRLIFESIIFDG